MPWVGTVEENKRRFLEEFSAPGADRRAVCARWGVSPKTAYKTLRRYETEGEAGLRERSRRPQHSPSRTPAWLEARVLSIRAEQPAWGARKIARLLSERGVVEVPSPSTITAILARHGCIEAEESQKRKELIRFEREHPNELWQMDFKGHFPLQDGSRCHPLMLLDDHSRYCAGAFACADQRGETVRAALTLAFRVHGLPEAMLMDNGSPWGNDSVHVYTPLVVWLIRLGMRVLHGRPRHPQTQGKLERLNRTFEDELLRKVELRALWHAQEAFDRWRPVYNRVRPHEALGMEVPARRYRVSGRAFPEELPAVEYDDGDVVRRVQQAGWLSYLGREYRIPKAFRGETVALRPMEEDGFVAVYFCRQRIAVIDLKGGRARPVRG